MLESINLENATGIIANFTGGEDLAFAEVVGALNSLQARCGGVADIIPGVISDSKMEDRVQVILVLTGLGATSLDQKPSKVEKPLATPVAEKTDLRKEDFPFLMDDPLPKDRPEATDPQSDIDIPAFIRRKQR